MTSKNSFSKLVRQNLTRRLWAVTLAVLGCLTSLTLPVVYGIQTYYSELQLMQQGNYYGSRTAQELLQQWSGTVAEMLGFMNPFIKIFLFILAILCGVSMFRYLHDRRQVDFYHALPISRSRLFAVQYVTGIVAVLPVYLLITLLTIASAAGLGFGQSLSAGAVCAGLIGNILFFLLNYTIAVLCTVMTGSTIITILLGLWAEFGIALVGVICYAMMSMSFSTFAETPALVKNLVMYGSPLFLWLIAGTDGFTVPLISWVTSINMSPASVKLLIGVLIATALLLALTAVLFIRRRSERAGIAVAFKPVQEPMKYFMSAVGGLCVALLLYLMMHEFWFWFGLIVGTVLVHMLVEIIYDFDFKSLFHHWKRMIILLVVLVAATAAVRCDVFGYDAYLPKRDDITTAGVWVDIGSRDMQLTSRSAAAELTTPENIDAVYALAALGVGEKPENTGDVPQCSVTVRFQLKNGRMIVRQYWGIPYDDAQPYIRSLRADPEYIETYALLQRLRMPESAEEGSAAVQVRTFATAYGGEADAKMRNLDEVRALIAQLQTAQIENRMAHLTEIPVLRVDLETNWNDSRMYREEAVYSYLSDIPVYPSDTEVLTAIEKITGVTPEQPSAEKISELNVVVGTQADYKAAQDQLDRYYNGEYAMVESADDKALNPYDTYVAAHTTQITDPEEIAKWLENAVPDTAHDLSGPDVAFETEFDGLSVMIEAILHNGDSYSLYYPEGKAPMDLIRALLPN